jgi:hypothetical protein
MAPDVEATLSGYAGGSVPGYLDDAVEKCPLLGTVLTDVAGIRSMPVDAALMILRGDCSASQPTNAYVATSGEVTLHRLDGPKDTLESTTLSLTEVTSTGQDGEVKPGGINLMVSAFYFEWPGGTN